MSTNPMRNKVKNASPDISVRNLQRKIRVNATALELFAQGAVNACQKLKEGRPNNELKELSVLLISDRRMARLHRQFLNQPGPTDVITFQHGEIFISVETARRQARQFGTSLTGELQLYIVHGLLHLHGYDDRTPSETKRMRAAEAAVLRRVTV
jgi:probable rRNA maturation factor